MTKLRCAATVLLLAGLLAGCSGDSTSSDEDSSGLACDHFRNVAGDISDGVLTDAEIREKFKEIDDNASIATSAVQSASRQMLQAITTGTTEDVLGAMTAMDSACEAVGH